MTSTFKSVVIGGGTGFIGSHLCTLLKSKGYNINILSRMPGPQRMSWHELKSFGLPEGTSAVINLSGQNVLDMTQRWNAGFKQNVFNSRVNTTLTLAQAISEAKKKPDVFITMSGVGIYKPDDKKEYTEDMAGSGFDFLSELCLEWEKAASTVNDIVRRVTIRSGVVLGRNGGMIKQLYLPYFFGLGGAVAGGKQYLPWIHINDLCRLILFAIENSEVKGPINGVAPQIITNKEFSDAFANAMNRPAFFTVPKFLLDIILNEERANMLTKGQKVVPKMAQHYGFKYDFPDIKTACKEVVK